MSSPSRHTEHLLVSNFKDINHLVELTGKVNSESNFMYEESRNLMHKLSE